MNALVEPGPLLLALSTAATTAVGRLLHIKAPLPAALGAAGVGALVGAALGEHLPIELLPVGGLAWPAPLVGALLAERFAARIASGWERGRRP